VDVELVLTVVEVVLSVVGVELDGVTVGVPLEQAAANTARAVTMTHLALIDPPRLPA
jgi:acetylglutamate kinase